MKLCIKLALLALILSSLFGCATSDAPFETALQPPDAFNAHFQRYLALPEEKVLVIAVDPGGRWAFAYDHNRETLKEAAENAAIKCDRAREKHKVFAKGKIFAINNKVVYNEL